MKKLNEQKLLVDRFYQRENENLIKFYSFVKNFCENDSVLMNNELSIVDHQKQIEELNDLKNSKIPFIQSWMFQVDQILENKSTIKIEGSIRRTKIDKKNRCFFFVLSADFELDSSEDSDVIPISDDEMMIESQLKTKTSTDFVEIVFILFLAAFDDESQLSSSYSDPNFSGQLKIKRSKSTINSCFLRLVVSESVDEASSVN